MKNILYFGFVFLIFVSTNTLQANSLSVEDNKIIAVFKGITEDGHYHFKGKDGKQYLFEDIGEETDTDLSDEANIGKTFEVTYKEETYDEYDDEGNPLGSSYTQKTIVSLTEK